MCLAQFGTRRENRTQLCGTFGRPAAAAGEILAEYPDPSFAPADAVRHRQMIGESAHRPFNRQHLRTVLRRQHATTKVLHLIRAFCYCTVWIVVLDAK
jgi:hypothetical protein